MSIDDEGLVTVAQLSELLGTALALADKLKLQQTALRIQIAIDTLAQPEDNSGIDFN